MDSEPSAIWQCLRGEDEPVSKLIITASGGPFRKRPLDEMESVTPAEALAHPTWVMGKKITVDSSTLMNKGFEVIESRWLFGVPFEKIEVVVHPQSVIHSMVEFADGSVKAQMGPPDMRLPIQVALAHPERVPNGSLPKYDPLTRPSLTFEELDRQRYPCFATALEAGAEGGTCPAVLSAADEVAVHLFLEGRIGFNDIHRIVRGGAGQLRAGAGHDGRSGPRGRRLGAAPGARGGVRVAVRGEWREAQPHGHRPHLRGHHPGVGRRA